MLNFRKTAFNKENPTDLLQRDHTNLKSASVVDRMIRLAYNNPDLRRPIMNALGRAASKSKEALSVGNGFENERGNFRIHRYNDSIRVQDLTNAGKRGKTVENFALYYLDGVPKSLVDGIARELAKASSYEDANRRAFKWMDEIITNDGFSMVAPKIELSSDKGVHIRPAGFKPIKLMGDFISIDAGYDSFVVRDLEDKNNRPTCIPAIKGGKKDIPVFYRWVKDNESKLKKMHFRDVVKGMGKDGIKFHQYCAMD